MTERSEVEKLFERQKQERAEFVRGQIKRLEDAGYDWRLPAVFREQTGYGSKGLLIERYVPGQEHSNHLVLSQDEGLIRVKREMDRTITRPVPLLGGGMTGSGISDLELLEQRVNEVLASLQIAGVGNN